MTVITKHLQLCDELITLRAMNEGDRKHMKVEDPDAVRKRVASQYGLIFQIQECVPASVFIEVLPTTMPPALCGLIAEYTRWTWVSHRNALGALSNRMDAGIVHVQQLTATLFRPLSRPPQSPDTWLCFQSKADTGMDVAIEKNGDVFTYNTWTMTLLDKAYLHDHHTLSQVGVSRHLFAHTESSSATVVNLTLETTDAVPAAPQASNRTKREAPFSKKQPPTKKQKGGPA